MTIHIRASLDLPFLVVDKHTTDVIKVYIRNDELICMTSQGICSWKQLIKWPVGKYIQIVPRGLSFDELQSPRKTLLPLSSKVVQQAQHVAQQLVFETNSQILERNRQIKYLFTTLQTIPPLIRRRTKRILQNFTPIFIQSQPHEQQQHQTMVVSLPLIPPKKRKKKKHELKTCVICEQKSSRSCLFHECLDDLPADVSTDLFYLCHDEDHPICGSCVYRIIADQKKLPSCPECNQETSFPHLFGILEAYERFKDVGDPIVDLSRHFLPCHVSQEMLDETQQSRVLNEFIRKTLIRQTNTTIRCPCHPHACVTGTRQGEMFVFQNHQHDNLCAECLKPTHQCALSQCAKTRFSANHYLSASAFQIQTLGEKKKLPPRRILRQHEMTPDMIDKYVQHLQRKIDLQEEYFICCPGCSSKYHRSEKCFELSCSCGYKMCSFCGYAEYSPRAPILDHFTSKPNLTKLLDPSQTLSMKCPRFSHNIKSELNVDVPFVRCTTECQSQKAGDCTRHEHAEWRNFLRTYRARLHMTKVMATRLTSEAKEFDGPSAAI